MPTQGSNQWISLLSDEAATGVECKWGGGAGLFLVEGTFNGATIKLQVRTPNGVWMDVGDETTLTAIGLAGFILPASLGVRAFVSGAPSAIFAYAISY